MDFDVIALDTGDDVFCDLCGEEWSASNRSGGILFQTKAVCPVCAPQVEKDAIGYGEQHLIRGRCPDGVPFAKWVRGLR